MSNNYGRESFATRQQLAANVKELRLRAGLKQEELAEYAKVTRQTISNIENATTTPQPETIKRILEVLGVPSERVQFDPVTETWLVTIGSLIETLPVDKRDPAANKVVRLLADEIKANVRPQGDNIDPIEQLDIVDFDASQDQYGLAANNDEEETEQ